MPYICSITRDRPSFKAYIRPHSFDNHVLTYQVDGVTLGVGPREYYLNEETNTIQIRKIDGCKILYQLVGEYGHEAIWLRIGNVPRLSLSPSSLRAHLRDTNVWKTIAEVDRNVKAGKTSHMFESLTEF